MPKYIIKSLTTKKSSKQSKSASKVDDVKKPNPTTASVSRSVVNKDVRTVASKNGTVRRKGIAYVSVSSSNLKGFYHDAQNRELFILFNNNRTYRFTGVPNYAVLGLANAPSKGAYFSANIRHKYSNKEI